METDGVSFPFSSSAMPLPIRCASAQVKKLTHAGKRSEENFHMIELQRYILLDYVHYKKH